MMSHRRWYDPAIVDARPAVAASACLLGAMVRYDGTDKRQPVLVATLQTRLRFVSLCPEVLAGLGVPRPPIAITRIKGEQRVVEVDNPVRDVTAPLAAAAQTVVDMLAAERQLCGAIFKARSPSCGVGNAPVMGGGATATATDGVAAAAVRRRFPGIAIVDEESLLTTVDCERFLRRCLLGLEYRRLPERLLHRWRTHYAWLWRQLGAAGLVATLALDDASRDEDWNVIGSTLGACPRQLDTLAL